MPALPDDGDQAALEQLGQVKAGGGRAHAGQPGQFPRRQRAVRQQCAQDRGPGRVGDKRRGRRDVGVPRKSFGGYGHTSTLAHVFFDRYRKMTDAYWATKWLVRPHGMGRATQPGRCPRARSTCPEGTATWTMPET